MLICKYNVCCIKYIISCYYLLSVLSGLYSWFFIWHARISMAIWPMMSVKSSSIPSSWENLVTSHLSKINYIQKILNQNFCNIRRYGTDFIRIFKCVNFTISCNRFNIFVINKNIYWLYLIRSYLFTPSVIWKWWFLIYCTIYFLTFK